MKVIKQGNKHIEDSKREYTCKKCESKLQVSKSDIQYDQRDGDYVICPVCKNFIASSLIFQS